MKKILNILILFIVCFSADAQVKESAVLNRKGVDLGNKGQFIEAERSFDKAISLIDKETAKTMHNMGWLCELKGENDAALVYYEEALRRNGEQLHTLERAGYLLYRSKQYEKSITYGEKVLKSDPLNQNVIKWLPDAYAQMFKGKEKLIAKNLEEIEQKKAEPRKEDPKITRVFTLSYEAMLRTTYRLKNGKGFHYKKTTAYGYNIPHMLKINLSPNDFWGINANTGVPYFGALSKAPVGWMEKAELFLKKNNYYLGLGFMGNHYYFRDSDTSKKLNDYKMGIVFGKASEKSAIDIAFYPRMFPSDMGASKGRTLDADNLDISYSYLIEKDLKFYGKMSLNDFYIFDHSVPSSDYNGIYAFTAGIGFYDSYDSPYVIRLEIIERMYLENLESKHPYAFINGQGLFGLDAYNWFKGKPLSGIKTFSTGFSFYFEERIVPHFFLTQKVTAEFVKRNQRGHDFCLSLGFGLFF